MMWSRTFAEIAQFFTLRTPKVPGYLPQRYIDAARQADQLAQTDTFLEKLTLRAARVRLHSRDLADRRQDRILLIFAACWCAFAVVKLCIGPGRWATVILLAATIFSYVGMRLSSA